MTNESDLVRKQLLETAADPQHLFHVIYLYTELRKVKRELSKNYLKKYKTEILQKLTEERKSIQLLDEDVHNKMIKFNDDVPSVIKNMSSLIRSSEISVAEDSNVTDTMDPECISKKDFCSISNSKGTPKITNHVKPVVSSPSTPIARIRKAAADIIKFDQEHIPDFLGLIELVMKFYNITSEEKFLQHRNQLMDILSQLKDYKCSDDLLNDLLENFQELELVKKEFNDLVRESGKG